MWEPCGSDEETVWEPCRKRVGGVWEPCVDHVGTTRSRYQNHRDKLGVRESQLLPAPKRYVNFMRAQANRENVALKAAVQH
jgi:hypothetical protein